MRRSVVLLLGVLQLGFANSSGEWQKIARGMNEFEVKTVAVDSKRPNIIYAGTSRALYKSIDQGAYFKTILFPQDKTSINHLYISGDKIYAATDNGLYLSADAGERWQRIFDSSDFQKRICLSVLEANGNIYLGTKRGLFYKNSEEPNWHSLSGEINQEPVYFLAFARSHLYIATAEKLFSLDQENLLQQIFSLGIHVQEDSEETEDNKEFDELKQKQFIRFLYIDPQHEDKIFLAATNHIYLTNNQGKDWQDVSNHEIPLEELTSLVGFEDFSHGQCQDDLKCLNLLASTYKGVFLLHDGNWQQLYKGMETNSVYYLVKDDKDQVYAATDKGVFVLSLEKTLPFQFAALTNNKSGFVSNSQTIFDFNNELSINQVHQLAIDYAEVNPEKIKQWRLQAKKKAILPHFTTSLGRSATDLFH